jgi:hypothetical protein
LTVDTWSRVARSSLLSDPVKLIIDPRLLVLHGAAATALERKLNSAY